MKRLLLTGLVSLLPVAVAWAEGDPPKKTLMAKVCSTCHKIEENTLMGMFDNISLKARKIQIKMDDAIEIVNFDPVNFKIKDGEKIETPEYLSEMPKNKEVRVEYSEKEGKKYATMLSIKQPLQVPKEMQITTADLAKLIAMGSEKGKYHLYDSRPPIRTQDGMIPTAVNLPFPMFDQNVDKLPKEKDSLVIFYCAGVTCAMSPSSAKKAQNLGYTNIKVYHEGMPEWSRQHYVVLTAKAYKEGWLDKGMPSVLIDLRATEEAEKGHLKGAVTVTQANLQKAIATFPPKGKKAPIIVYGADTGEATKAAETILSSGYGNVKVLQGGMKAWNESGFLTEKGQLETKIAYVPKPKPGEIVFDDFKKIVDSGLKDVLLIDVRPSDEAHRGIIKGARNIPMVDMDKQLGDLPKDKAIIAYCNTGTLAEMAYYTLKEKGYTNVKFVNKSLEIDSQGTYKVFTSR